MASVCNNHSVFFYHGEQEFPAALYRLFSSAVVSGCPMVLFMTPEHRRLFEQFMRSQNLDPGAMSSARLLAQFDAAETLSRFCGNGTVDTRLFREVIGGELSRIAEFHCGRLVWAYGEMVDVLAKQGRRNQAIELEHLWNKLAEEMEFSLLCGYELDPMAAEADREFVMAACDAHSQVRMLPREIERSMRLRTALRQEVGYAEAENIWSAACASRQNLPDAYQVLMWLREHRPGTAEAVYGAVGAISA